MNSSATQDTDLAILRNDLSTLKQDVASVIEHLKAGITHGAQSAASRVDDGSRQLYRDAAAEGERSIKIVRDRTERQPLAALLLAFGVGFVGGRLLAR
jgi:hypothetical protein